MTLLFLGIFETGVSAATLFNLLMLSSSSFVVINNSLEYSKFIASANVMDTSIFMGGKGEQPFPILLFICNYKLFQSRLHKLLCCA